jgi:hypothetical protein
MEETAGSVGIEHQRADQPQVEFRQSSQAGLEPVRFWQTMTRCKPQARITSLL